MSDGTRNSVEEGVTFPHLVKWVEMVTRAQAERAIRSLPISGSQLFALVLLSERGEATSADLARMMQTTPQALTTLLRPLRDGGYIERRTDDEHARRMPLKLTAKGQAILEQARAHSPAIEDTLLADFSAEERATLKEYLARIARRFDGS